MSSEEEEEEKEEEEEEEEKEKEEEEEKKKKKKKKNSPVKEPSLKVPFMESLAERCPTTRALLHSSIKVPSIRAPPSPHTRFPSD
jgi:chromatin remodeling complex protein RSC6